MRIKKNDQKKTTQNNNYFGNAAKFSVKKDFNKTPNYKREEPRQQPNQEPAENSERRVINLTESGSYAKYSRFIVGKLVKLLRRSDIGSNSWFVEFVFDDDRKALNRAADWSDNKKEYLLDGVKFK